MTTLLDRLRAAYHALVPTAIRYPIGHARRVCLDQMLRLRTPLPVPPAAMLRTVQLTEWAREYLDVGGRCATAIAGGFADLPAGAPRVLDFGSGLGRTIRHLDTAGWRLFGCDIDHAAIFWSARALPMAQQVITGTEPPGLPFASAIFDAAYGVSVFTHFDASAQSGWAGELARVVRPGGLLAISSMGLHALSNFAEIDGPACRRVLAAKGFFYFPGGTAFNARAAFHTGEGLVEIFGPWFELRRWQEAGLDGFQDLALFERRKTTTPRV